MSNIVKFPPARVKAGSAAAASPGRVPVDVRADLDINRLGRALGTEGLTVRYDARAGRVVIEDERPPPTAA